VQGVAGSNPVHPTSPAEALAKAGFSFAGFAGRSPIEFRATDKINSNPANVVMTNSIKPETDPNNAFRSGSSKELIVNLSKSAKTAADLNVGRVQV
jgi:hypothetical protein